MKNLKTKLSLTLSALVLATACTSQGPTFSADAVVAGIPNLREQKFVANPGNGMKPVKDFTDEEFSRVRGQLNSNKFKGISGITSRAFVRVAQSKPEASGKKGVTVKGQIIDTCLHDPTLEGYFYDKSAQTVRLCVLMVTQLSNPLNQNAKVRYQYFHVEATSAQVDRKDLNYPDYPAKGVFPNAYDKTGLAVSAATAADFQSKLYAWGDNIKIVNYWEANSKTETTTPNWKTYVAGQNGMPNRIRDYFETDRGSCIDMMFPGKVPSTLAPDAIGGIHYCLGRCSDPAIVNTR